MAALVLIVFAACTKIDTTQLGDDLIPEVDNIHTFDTVLSVVANNYIVEDSTRLNASDLHMVGGISDDPVFGKTRSSMFFEMMPANFPTILATDSARTLPENGFDSAVLILNYVGYYGDSASDVHLKLYDVAQKMIYDKYIRPEYNIKGVSKELGTLSAGSRLLGEKTIKAIQFKDSIEIRRGTRDSVYEKVANQLRIPLDPTFAKELFLRDSSTFSSDSAFREFFTGFALVPESNANALFYFSLSGSKVEFFVRQKNTMSDGVQLIDTTKFAITFNSSCGHAIQFDRDRTGAEVEQHIAFEDAGKDEIYIQATPGTAAKITVPGIPQLASMNRVIHRAELRVTQLGYSEPAQMLPPNGLYLDVKTDVNQNIYKGIPIDLSPYTPYYCYPAEEISFGYFGGITRYEKSASLPTDSAAVYRFNLTRYVQSVVTRGETFHELRLSAPFYNFYENCANSSTAYPVQVFPFVGGGTIINPVGRGRIKLAGGTAAVDPAIRMHLRVIYSKL